MAPDREFYVTFPANEIIPLAYRGQACRVAYRKDADEYEIVAGSGIGVVLTQMSRWVAERRLGDIDAPRRASPGIKAVS